MCDPVTLITTAMTTALGIAQQAQQASAQQANYNGLANQQRAAAALDEHRAQVAGQEGEAAIEQAHARTAQRLGTAQARLAAQGSDLLGSPVDVMGDLAAAGEEDALSLRYQAMRNAWENRVRGAARQAQAGAYETKAGAVDPTLGIVQSLLS